jgi:orotidine-5'-phosphate decarboxylase
MFAERFKELVSEKESHLCVGLDPPLDSRGEILDFCLEMIEEISDSAIAVKPNTQFILPLSDTDMKKVTRRARRHDLLVILDHKLSDIGSSNASAIRWISKCGFDAFTFSPFAGNFSTIDEATRVHLDVFTLALMSNPEAHYFGKAIIEGQEGFRFVCRKVVEHNGCGCVVGATCAREDIKASREILGERIILVPGIGVQGGSLETLPLFGGNTIFNIGRDIISSRNPSKKAKEYRVAIETHLFR